MRSLLTRCPARVVAALVVAAGGASSPAARADVPAPDNDPFYAVPAGLDGLANGSVIDNRSITATALSIPLPATSWQIKYKTLDNQGAPTATVATVMVSTAPFAGPGPRPVVSYQTAEDGVGTKCSPSYTIRGGLGAGVSNSSPETLLMEQALQRGWIVVAPDYEGPHSMFLGSDGEAREVLDGLRAARSFGPAGIDPSAPLALWGYSGGAVASSVAAQLQPQYAPELRFSGVALGGVVADIRATIHDFSGSFAGGALIMGFVAVDRSYPQYHLQQYLNDAARAAMANSQSDCITDAALKYPFARLEQYTSDPGLIDGPTLKPLFDQISPLTRPGVPAAPVYDYHAIPDELAPIGPDRALIDRFCRAGVQVQKVEDPIGEHLTEAGSGAPGAVSYLADRFAGHSAPNNCAVPPDSPPTGAGGHTSASPVGAGPPAGGSCRHLRTVTFKLHHTRYGPITKVRVYDGYRLLLTRHGRRLRTVKLGLSQTGSQRIRIATYDRRGLARRSTRMVSACGNTRPSTKSRARR
ncbi:MAG: lipase family protein [Solirubrobacteraceae bacterium]